MAVFVAAGDETERGDQRGTFIYGGFVGPTLDWINWFAPAWEERVLNAKPPIPHLHMVDIRSSKWRARYGLTQAQAEAKVDEAARVIGSLGSITFCKSEMDGGHFRDAFRTTRMAKYQPQPQTYALLPDHIGFFGFAYAVLDYVASSHPNAEKVDFVVERKTGVTHRIPDFVESLGDALVKDGRPELVRLIGELIPGGKDRAPLQAADVGVWHWRRHGSGELDRDDMRRMLWMFEGREMMVNGLLSEHIDIIRERTKNKTVPSPFGPRVKISGGAA